MSVDLVPDLNWIVVGMKEDLEFLISDLQKQGVVKGEESIHEFPVLPEMSFVFQ